MRPLEDILVLDFSQFLSGPLASLRLADLGATVIKIERPESGDISREMYVSDCRIDGDSTIFHAINRNKLGYAADLKKPDDQRKVYALIEKADVILHNFRPSVAERLGIDYQAVRARNPRTVYAEITGYGNEGPWAEKPGQDLLLQAVSGITWLSGNADDGPVPMGLAVVDIWAGTLAVVGILSALVRRDISGEGSLVEVNMLEAALDFQFEPLTMHLQDGSLPERTTSNNAHTLLGAPYGVYKTANGYLALAMGSIPQLGELLGCPSLGAYTDPDSLFTQRDEIKNILAGHLKNKPTKAWLEVLEPADIWCAEVLDWECLLQHEGFTVLQMIQSVQRGTGIRYDTTCCPIQFDQSRSTSDRGSCSIGEHQSQIEQTFAIES